MPNRSAGILSQNGLALRQARLVAATAVHMSSVQGTEPSDLTTKAITGALRAPVGAAEGRAYAFVVKSDGSVPWTLDIWTAVVATRRACRRASPFCDKIPADLFGNLPYIYIYIIYIYIYRERERLRYRHR